VVVKETASGLGASELLVDPLSKHAYPEHGPNMMWNLKYGGINHSGMMGSWQNQDAAPRAEVPGEMPVAAAEARDAAQAYLDQHIEGATAAAAPMQFYGYYTFDFEKDGQVVGMLSVNGYTGQVFLHTWHGLFIQETE